MLAVQGCMGESDLHPISPIKDPASQYKNSRRLKGYRAALAYKKALALPMLYPE